MFVRQNQQQFRNSNADVQIFYGDTNTNPITQRTWSKPPGVSHIYMMLIGPGGNGDGSATGGASGAVTVWYGAAQNVPDSLIAIVGGGDGQTSTVSARFRNSALVPTALLTANGASTTVAGTSMTANQFTASGFFQSVSGQGGGFSSASTTTFLSCGENPAANYGYSLSSSPAFGFFMLQPIIVGIGGIGSGKGGIGCGGGFGSSGGPGMVLIASW